MAKPIKIILSLLGVLLLLLVAAVVALPLLFDPNDYRGRIAEQVKKQTGREFSVGAIKLSVFPWLRVELSDVVLGNAQGFGEAPMLTVKRAEVGAKLMPLLREKRVEASAVTLEGVALSLAVDAQGRSNWQDLIKPVAADAPVQDATLAERMRPLDVASITLKDAAIRYDDRQAAQQLAISDLQLSTGRLRGAAPFAVDGRFKASPSAAAFNAAVEFSTQVTVSGESDLRLSPLKLKLDADQAGASPVQAVLALQSDALSYAASTRKLSGAPLTLTIDKLVMGAPDKPQLTANGAISAQLNADLATRQHSLSALKADLRLGGSAMPQGKPQVVQMSGNVVADLARQEVKISGLALAAMGLQLSGRQWLVTALDTAPRLNGDVAVAPFDPRKLMSLLGIAAPQTADASVLTSMVLSGQLSATAQAAELGDLMLKLDNTTMRGTLSVRDFAKPAFGFALKGDQLDADRYLPTPVLAANAPATANTAKEKADINATELPVKMIQSLNAQGTMELAALKLKNLKLANVRLRLDGAPGALKRQQLAANLYGGSADLAVSVSPAARHAVKLVLTGINAGPLLKDFLNSDKLSGKGSMTLDVTTAGETIGDVRRALNGTLAFKLSDGAVKGFNLGKIMRDGQALLTQQAPAASSAQATDFAELSGSGVFVNGVLKSDQLDAKNPLIRLEGAGEIDLVHDTINYLAKPTLVNTASGQGGKERIDLSGIVIPIRLSGDLYKPKVAIDWQAALKQQAVSQLREKLGVSEEVVREKRDELRSKAKEELSKGLLKLFGGKKPAAEPAPDAPAP